MERFNMESKDLFNSIMDNMLENLKRIGEMELEKQLEGSIRLQPKKEDKKISTYEVTTPFGEWDVECHAMESISDEEDHLIFIKDDVIVGEFWDVNAWVKIS